MLRKTILIVVGVCVGSAQACAESRVDEAVKLSNLAHSAMECSQLTSSADEEKRLFDVAMTTGKEFFILFEKLSHEEKEQAKFRMHFDWAFAYKEPGNYDFRLGRLWSAITFDRDLDFNRQDEEWKRKADYDRRKIQKDGMFSGKNCIYIH